MTPRQYDALKERFDIEQERRDFRAAQIACILANANRAKSAKPYKLEDFMPKYATKRKKETASGRPVMSVEQMKAIAKEITLAFGGKVKEKKKGQKAG